MDRHARHVRNMDGYIRLQTYCGLVFLAVPSPDCYGRSVSQPSSPDVWSTVSTGSPFGPTRPCVQPSCTDSDSEDDSAAPGSKR